MSRNPKDINEVLDEFAHDIAKDAKAEDSLEQKVDAFKALTAYAALRFKMNQKGEALDDEDGEPTMEDLGKVIALGSKGRSDGQ